MPFMASLMTRLGPQHSLQLQASFLITRADQRSSSRIPTGRPQQLHSQKPTTMIAPHWAMTINDKACTGHGVILVSQSHGGLLWSSGWEQQ